MADNQQQKDDFKYIVRIANTDLDGKYQASVALAAIRGVGVRVSALLCERAGIPKHTKIGEISDEQMEKLQQLVEQLPEILPAWMLNRPKDLETGEDIFLHTSELDGKKRDDLNRLKKIRTYRGVRHEDGQKVRGQRSRSNGRTGLTVGVIKNKEQAQKQAGS